VRAQSVVYGERSEAAKGAARAAASGGRAQRAGTRVGTPPGGGDMVTAGLQDVIRTAARGGSVTCVLLNNGVFGETGGQMTSTTVLGQRTKNSLDGRDAETHGYPILIADLISRLQGASYVARGSVHDAKNVHKTRRLLDRAFESQMKGQGFSFVEILTMCPTGWFIPTADGPDFLHDELAAIHKFGELKRDGVLVES